MFPILLDLTDRLGVVVGGGSVGQRKARAILEAGGMARIISLTPRPPQWEEPRLEWIMDPYRRAHLKDATLIFAAATAEVNRKVVQDARENGIPVNSATDPQSGTFFVPAILRKGDLVVAISTQGKAPAMARHLRLSLSTVIDEAHALHLELLSEARPSILAHIPEESSATLWESLCAEAWRERLRGEPFEVVREAFWEEVEAAVDSMAPRV